MIRSRGHCNTMGTASTMAVLCEVLGLMVPGSATIPAGEERGRLAARTAGQLAVRAVHGGLRPQSILTSESFSNAIIAVHAIGGSTKAVVHLAAMAGRAGVPFALEEIARLGATVPVLADVEPSGSGLMADFDEAGGVPTLLRELAGLLQTGACTVAGQTIGDVIAGASPATGAIRPAADPLREGGAFGIVRGSLAPDGAVIKTSAATAGLLRHRGPAVVFRGYDDMLARIDDPALPITAQTVLVLAGCGPVGVPGMPEWGMIPIPARLVQAGVTDMVRITDSRMSGTSFGTVVLHAAPEGAIGGPVGLVRDGDIISLDVPAGTVDLEISADELERRRAAWTPPPSKHLRGWPALYAGHVLQAPEGCDLDFLQAPTPAHRTFVEPVVGRS
jgi:dihydroxy-acid dehydratase